MLATASEVAKSPNNDAYSAEENEGKPTFSLSQMSNDELAQSLPWRENVG